MSATTDAVRDLFARAYGGAPEGFWRGPGRVNLIGEHTDYNEGFVLPFAIDRSATIGVSARTDRVVRVVSTYDGVVVETSLDRIAVRDFSGWSAYVLGVVWAMGDRGVDLGSRTGFDLALDSDVPFGAGLSSSAAIEMASAVAVNELWATGFDHADLARIGQRAENIAVGAPTGLLDQSASVFGEPDAAVFLDCRALTVEQVPLGFDAAGLTVLVVDTKVEHQHATGGYRDRRESCERGAEAMGVPALRDLEVGDLPRARQVLDDVTYRRVKHIVTEDARVLASVAALKAGDLAAFGALMDASHVSMRDDFEISVPQLDAVVAVAQAAGAVGARMTGGGFGGSAIALLQAGQADTVAAEVARVFADRGWAAPVSFTVVPSDGARRLEVAGD